MEIIFDSYKELADASRAMAARTIAGEHPCPKEETGPDCLLLDIWLRADTEESRRAIMKDEEICASCWNSALMASKKIKVREAGNGEDGWHPSAPEFAGPMPITDEMRGIADRAVADACKKVNREIRHSVEKGYSCAPFPIDKDDPMYAEVRGKYEKAGYRIFPIGCSGGVLQDGEKITW